MSGHVWIHSIPTGKFPSIIMKNILIWISIFPYSMNGILNDHSSYGTIYNLKIPKRAIFSTIRTIWTWHNSMKLTSIHFSIWQNQKWSSSGYVRTWRLRQIKVFDLNLTSNWLGPTLNLTICLYILMRFIKVPIQYETMSSRRKCFDSIWMV